MASDFWILKFLAEKGKKKDDKYGHPSPISVKNQITFHQNASIHGQEVHAHYIREKAHSSMFDITATHTQKI